MTWTPTVPAGESAARATALAIWSMHATETPTTRSMPSLHSRGGLNSLTSTRFFATTIPSNMNRDRFPWHRCHVKARENVTVSPGTIVTLVQRGGATRADVLVLTVDASVHAVVPAAVTALAMGGLDCRG